MNLNLRQVQALVAVDRFRSFTKAAESLHLSQPALTIQIRHLEEAVGLKLFDRTTRVVRLTDAGREILEIAESILEKFDHLANWSSDSFAGGKRVIRMACLPSMAARLLPVVIADFRAAHEEVGFVLKDEVGQHIVAEVRRETVEFGITDVDVHSPDLESSLLFAEAMHVYFGKNHPLGKVDRVTVAEIADYPLILMSRESNARAMLDRAFADSRLMPRTVCDVVYMSTAIALVQAGLGITVLPPTAVATGLMPNIGSRRIDDRQFDRKIAVVRKIGRSLSPMAEEFVARLKAHCRVSM